MLVDEKREFRYIEIMFVTISRSSITPLTIASVGTTRNEAITNIILKKLRDSPEDPVWRRASPELVKKNTEEQYVSAQSDDVLKTQYRYVVVSPSGDIGPLWETPERAWVAYVTEKMKIVKYEDIALKTEELKEEGYVLKEISIALKIQIELTDHA